MKAHKILGDKVNVYRRERSRYWQCSTFMAGRNQRTSTKEESLAQAKEFAEDWYLELRGKLRNGELKREKTFKDAAQRFVREYEVLTDGERSPTYAAAHESRLRLHLIPFFGAKGLSEITGSLVQDYRVHRLSPQDGSPVPSRSTMHHDIVTLRQVLKTAVRHGWLDGLPDLSEPYRKSSKVTHRAWFSPDEYKQLYTATRQRAATSKAEGQSWHWANAQLHDYVLFMANTGLRPDEANNLEFRDVDIVDDEDTGETILEIEVRGKRGVGYCKSMPGAVQPYQRIVERHNPEPIDKVFAARHKKQFNRILESEGLKFDREGNRRTAYSLRHTYICFRLLEGADIYQVAKNCRTSVEMIEKHYAVHLKNSLDAAAINVRKSRSTKRERPKVS